MRLKLFFSIFLFAVCGNSWNIVSAQQTASHPKWDSVSLYIRSFHLPESAKQSIAELLSNTSVDYVDDRLEYCRSKFEEYIHNLNRLTVRLGTSEEIEIFIEEYVKKNKGFPPQLKINAYISTTIIYNSHPSNSASPTIEFRGTINNFKGGRWGQIGSVKFSAKHLAKDEIVQMNMEKLVRKLVDDTRIHELKLVESLDIKAEALNNLIQGKDSSKENIELRLRFYEFFFEDHEKLALLKNKRKETEDILYAYRNTKDSYKEDYFLTKIVYYTDLFKHNKDTLIRINYCERIIGALNPLIELCNGEYSCDEKTVPVIAQLPGWREIYKRLTKS